MINYISAYLCTKKPYVRNVFHCLRAMIPTYIHTCIPPVIIKIHMYVVER